MWQWCKKILKFVGKLLYPVQIILHLLFCEKKAVRTEWNYPTFSFPGFIVSCFSTRFSTPRRLPRRSPIFYFGERILLSSEFKKNWRNRLLEISVAIVSSEKIHFGTDISTSTHISIVAACVFFILRLEQFWTEYRKWSWIPLALLSLRCDLSRKLAPPLQPIKCKT